MVRSLRELLDPTRCFLALGAGAAMAALLCVPRAGLALGIGFALVMSWFYQDNMERAGLDFARIGEEIEPLRIRDRILRALLGCFGLCALLAPLFFRNWGHLLPGDRTVPMERSLMISAFSAWLVTPLILLAFNARDVRGRLSPPSALRLLLSHPFATLAGLLVLPVGFLAAELCVAVASWYEGVMPLMLSDLFPTPAVNWGSSGRLELRFFYDDLHPVVRPVDQMIANAFPDYVRAIGRGFFLSGTIPESLPLGKQIRFDPSFFGSSVRSYFWFRYLFAAFILASSGCVLAVQSVWLGLVVAIGSRRAPREETAPTIHPQIEPVQHVVEPHAPTEPVLPAAWSGLQFHPVDEPAANASSAPAGPTTPAAGSNGTRDGVHVATRRTILIVDDERAFAHAIGRILAERGHAVLIAGGYEEGLRQARVARPDVIVLDLLLPDRPGLELCRQLRSEAPTRDTPIIVTTYKSGTEEEIGTREAGADDFLAKPYVVDVLIAQIERRLVRSQALAVPHV